MAGIYVHIPFCHSKCIYCDFFSTPRTADGDAYARAVVSEYQRLAGQISGPVTTVYFGGGTPSILPPGALRRIADALPMTGVAEFTIEVNPEDVSDDAVRAWRDIGINRVSMGIQSFDDAQLRSIGRRHSAADALSAVDCLRRGGITNISCDLIYGLPGQSLESWRRSLRQLLDLRLPHLSAYCLSYEPSTALYRLMERGRVTPADDSLLADMYHLLCREAADAGYQHYEISNFALPGMHSRHNSSYWDGTPYLGLGPGAHSFDGAIRRYNTPDIAAYLAGRDISVIDHETDDERFNDRLITALRTSAGLCLGDLDTARADYLLSAAAPHIALGSIIHTDGRLRITESAWLISDSILRDLIIA